MANHALPTASSTYANFVIELNARIDDALKWTSSVNTTPTNAPTNTVRWNDTSLYWEKNTGTAAAPTWSLFSSTYNININGTVGATTANTGSFTTLTTSGIASLGANSTVGGVAITTASNTQTLTNKTLTSPILSTIVNTGTLTLPTATDTLVGRATVDTFTNKTLTDPKFTSAAGLKDTNGISILQFPATVASAVNYLTLNNTITGAAPNFVATGADTNISINLVPKGTGVIQANGIQVADLSSAQTFTNKTLTTPGIASVISSGFTITFPVTGSDTLANLTGTQSLSNKTFTASAFNGTVGATTASSGAFTTITASTSLSVTGTATATTFSGAGTSLTGTATSLNIGGNAGSATLVAITDDIATATTVYPVWNTSTSGNQSVKSSSTKLSFVPSTGTLSATTFSGAGTSLTGTAASLTVGNATNWGSYGGVPTAGSVPGVNGIPRADANGYIFFNYINSNTANGENPTISQIIVTNGTDGYYRKATLAALSSVLTGTAASLTAGTCSGNSATATRSTYLTATQLDTVITGITSSMSMTVSESTTRGSFVARATGTGDANLAGMAFYNDAYAIKLGVRADGYFGLGGWSRAAWSWYSDPSGNMVAAGNVTAYSDPKLKEDFQVIEKPFEILDNLDGGTFRWKTGFKHTECKAGKRDYGILADQVEATMPEIVYESISIDGENFRTVSYEKIIPVLIEAVKSLKAEIKALKGEQ